MIELLASAVLAAAPDNHTLPLATRCGLHALTAHDAADARAAFKSGQWAAAMGFAGIGLASLERDHEERALIDDTSQHLGVASDEIKVGHLKSAAQLMIGVLESRRSGLVFNTKCPPPPANGMHLNPPPRRSQR